MNMENQVRIHQYSNYPIPHLKVDHYMFEKKFCDRFSRETMLRFRFIPVDIYDNNLTAIVSFPCIENIEDLKSLINGTVQIFWDEDIRLVKKINELKNGSYKFLKSEGEKINWKG